MNTYSSYKDSGVEWIGDIPSEWDSLKLKYIFSEKPITHNTELNCGSISFGRVVFKDNDKVPISTKKSYQEVLEGEYLINPLNLNYDLKSLRIGLSDIDVVVSSGYIVIKNRIEISKSYYKWLLHIYDILHMKLLGSGVRQTISFNHISNSILTYPPLHEQQQISDYLDYKTLKIDTLIEKTQQKIELLKEQRTSLINTTVTKGLNPNVEMKDSGVEWIGEIPVEWDTTQIKFICKMMRGKFSHRPRNDQRFYDGEYPFIQTGDISSTGMYLTKFNQTLNERGFSVSKEFPIDTVVMTIAANIGDVSILKIRSCFPDSIIGFHPYHDMSVKYLYYILTSLKDELHKNSTVSTQMNLNVERVGSIKIPLSTVQEQQQIVDYLDKETLRIDKLVDIESKRIILLKEYRQSLISDVVTGKVDVRDEVLV
jgi:type I restriction enzyme S subunit